MTPEPPRFSRLSRRVLVDNPWHRYCHDRYTRRDGSAGDYYYVDMAGSCGIVPLFADGSTLLVCVRRYLLQCQLWEFPIGGMKPGEDPLAVAQHELEEEAGLQAGRWDRLGQFAPYKGVSTEITHFFVARDLVEVPARPDLDEDITAHRMSLAQARERLISQELPDGQSLAGLALLERWLLNAR